MITPQEAAILSAEGEARNRERLRRELRKAMKRTRYAIRDKARYGGKWVDIGMNEELEPMYRSAMSEAGWTVTDGLFKGILRVSWRDIPPPLVLPKRARYIVADVIAVLFWAAVGAALMWLAVAKAGVPQ